MLRHVFPWTDGHLTFILYVVLGFACCWRIYHERSEQQRQRTESEAKTGKDRDSEARIRKQLFLKSAGNDYGYGSSSKGFIDQWRKEEFPRLIAPLGPNCSPGSDDDKDMVYLDCAGASLPSKSQLRAILETSSEILANPHSTGPAASRSSQLVAEAKKRISDHFNCAPGRFAGLSDLPEGVPASDQQCYHPGYDIVFTSGTTEALSILANRFPWRKCDKCSSASQFVYSENSHTSVIGMRNPAISEGAQYCCMSVDKLCRVPLSIDGSAQCACGQKFMNLLAVPLESNFEGDRPDFRHLFETCRSSSHWFALADIAKAASTGPVDLKAIDPDFACVSFYKVFGEPTGLGALFVRRTAVPTLMNGSKRMYFGGGSVDAILPRPDFAIPRNQPNALASLSNGTVHFRGIASLVHGFDELGSLGGMNQIHRHTMALTKYLMEQLQRLKHSNGRHAVEIYSKGWDEKCSKHGPVVAFNVLRDDGSYVGCNEVSKLAELNDPPIQMRTGCFCNPGACQSALGLDDDEVQRNYYTSGHVCGDHVDIISGKPTGGVRISIGKENIWEDLNCFLQFLERSFVSYSARSSELNTTTSGPSAVIVTELYLFPIKSCAGQRVKDWTMRPNGRLEFDREFALVDSTGSAMRLQRYPQMTKITPVIDKRAMTMTVSAPGLSDLRLSLLDESSKPNGMVRVCGEKCGGELWGDFNASKWFSEYLGVECWLARYVNGRYQKPGSASVGPRPKQVGFSNEEALLLISEHAVARLNEALASRGEQEVETRHFRPNVVVRWSDEVPSNDFGGSLKSIRPENESGFLLNNAGECARCSMVDFDPKTGLKGNTLRTLADYRRSKGRINFGIFLKLVQDKHRGESYTLSENQTFCCEY